MTDTTTIEITDEQKAQLQELKQHDRESYKAVIGRLLEGVDPTEGVDPEAIAEAIKNELSMANEPGVEIDTQEIIGRIEDLENSLPSEVAQEVLNQR